MHFLDLVINTYISHIRTVQLTEYMYLLSMFFDITYASVLVTLCVAVLVYLFRAIRYALLFLITLVSGAVLAYVLKIMFNVARPTGGVLTVIGTSFPSYHALVATVFFVMLMFIFDDYFNSFGRIVFNTLCISLIFLVAASRVYLGVHWSSDVLGGVCSGAVLSYVSICFFRWYTQSVINH